MPNIKLQSSKQILKKTVNQPEDASVINSSVSINMFQHTSRGTTQASSNRHLTKGSSPGARSPNTSVDLANSNYRKMKTMA